MGKRVVQSSQDGGEICGAQDPSEDELIRMKATTVEKLGKLQLLERLDEGTVSVASSFFTFVMFLNASRTQPPSHDFLSCHLQFGTVYKGLRDGIFVAVKVMSLYEKNRKEKV